MPFKTMLVPYRKTKYRKFWEKQKEIFLLEQQMYCSKGIKKRYLKWKIRKLEK